MRSSNLFGKTLKEPPTDTDSISHQLLLRAGYIQQVAAGIFSFLPLGWRSISKIKQIMREEMNAAHGQEINMPVVQPKDLWDQSGRADQFIPPLATFIDRRERQMVLAPTHEETAAIMARAGISSYRDLPFILYHIQTKFRDEPRPRGGLLRVREFEMKDAYSFDKEQEGLETSFQLMVGAYKKIFNRCNTSTVMVQADSGGIGGKASNEFVLLADNGEDVILICGNKTCGYAANLEKAEFIRTELLEEQFKPIEKFATPNVSTIRELTESEGVQESKTIKTVAYSADKQIMVVVIRGDYNINETKLRNISGFTNLRIASPSELKAKSLIAGSLSPIGLDRNIRVIADKSVKMGTNFLAGANEKGFHFRNINFPRDFTADLVDDIAEANAGDTCPNCSGTFKLHRGIEVGHVFKLGTVYSEKLGVLFSDESGDKQPVLMGCYGIGVGRLLAAAVEANHDENGIVLPRAIAPFEIHLVGLNLEQKPVNSLAETLYHELKRHNIDVLFDDRDSAPGSKLKDADLIGIPLRIVISHRSIKTGGVEVKARKQNNIQIVPQDKVITVVRELLDTL